MTTELKPCPWCAAGETIIYEDKGTWTGKGYGEPVSIEVRHWCPAVEGQPSRLITSIGRDRESAIAAWNKRAESEPSKADLEARKRVAAALGLPTNGMRDGKPVSFGWEYLIGLIEDAVKVAEDDAAPPSAQTGAQERAAIARAIWNIRREDEDRCDMELEDVGRNHSVWRDADAVLALLAAQGKESE